MFFVMLVFFDSLCECGSAVLHATSIAQHMAHGCVYQAQQRNIVRDSLSCAV